MRAAQLRTQGPQICAVSFRHHCRAHETGRLHDQQVALDTVEHFRRRSTHAGAGTLAGGNAHHEDRRLGPPGELHDPVRHATLDEVNLTVIERGSTDEFDDLCTLLTKLGYTARKTKGSHIIFQRGPSFLNLQPTTGGKAKAYQVRQVREELQKLNLKP